MAFKFNPFTSTFDYYESGGGGGASITVVANYSALPAAGTVTGEFYWCSAAQGTWWLPGSLGGTYYNSGLYYSNGVSWERLEHPYNATQTEVNTGTNADKFVTPDTFTNATKWSTKKTIATGNAYKFETTDASGNLQETTVTASRAVATDANGLPTASATTSTELGYVNGVTSSIQTQLDLKSAGDVSWYRKTGTTTLERWYTSAICAYNAGSSTTLPTNTLKAIPFIVSKPITLDRIAMEITGAGTASSLVRIGIYDSVNGIPTNLILDAGTIAGDSATFQSITINQALPIGLYWLACVTNSAASITFRSIPVAAMPAVLGVPNNLGTGNSATTIQSTFTYAALPDPFDLTSVTATAQNPGAISVRLSA